MGKIAASGQGLTFPSATPLIAELFPQVINYCITKLLKVIKRPDTIKLLRHCKSYFGDVTEREIVHAQHSKYKNGEKNGGVFQLKPDIVIEKNGVEEIIIDTKWKSISSVYNRHGVNTQDIYQMYAYITRYENVKLVILLYPDNENIESNNLNYLESWMLDGDHKKKIKICSVSLENEIDTIKKLKEIINIKY